MAMEYGRLSSALHDLSAHELFEVSCVLGFQVEEDLGGGEGGGRGRRRREARGARRLDGEECRVTTCVASPQANWGLLGTCHDWGLGSRHIPTPRAKSNLQLERSSRERTGERKSGSQRGGDGGGLSLLHLY
jgi:hypothetical protein